MNKVYKVIYSKVKQCNVVVSEIAKSHGRHTKSSVAKKKAALAAATLTLPGLIAVETMPTAEAGISDHNEVAGGKDNTTGGTYSTIAGGSMNSTGAYGALVAGGNSNVATSLVDDKNYEVDYDRQYYDECSTVAGGYKNTALGDYSTLVGGSDGVIQGRYSTGIAGGSTGARADHALAMGYGAVVTDDGVLKTITDFTNKATGEVTKQVAYSNVSTAIGYQATANQAGTISFGHDKGDVSGYTVTWQQDEPDALGVYHNSPKDGTHNRYDLAPTVTANTYDSSYYNRLVKLADGINGRDAVTMRQAAVSNGDKADTTADNIGANYKVVKTDESGNVVYDEQTGLPTLVAASDDQKKANESAWGTALGTGKVESGNDQLVTGGTVYDAIKDIPTSASLAGKADVTADNIGKNLKNADGADASDADQKANAVKWGEAIGLGAVNEHDDKLMTSNGVYSEVRPSDGNYIHSNSTTAQNLTALDTQVKNNADAISNITYAAGNGITLENKKISAKAGKGIKVDSNGISVNYNTSHLTTDTDGALNILDNGAIASGNTGLVTGDTIYQYLQQHASDHSAHYVGIKSSDATSSDVNYNGGGASGDKTVAIGSGVSVTGNRSNSVGYKNAVAGTLSDVYGNGNTINEGTHNAVVLGNGNKVGSNSVAIGTWDKANATNSVFVGGNDVSTSNTTDKKGWSIGIVNADGTYTETDNGGIREITDDEAGNGAAFAKKNLSTDESDWDDDDTSASATASAKAASFDLGGNGFDIGGSSSGSSSSSSSTSTSTTTSDTIDKVTVVGKSADAKGTGSVSLGYGAQSDNGNIAIGYNSQATAKLDSSKKGYLTNTDAPSYYVSVGDGMDTSAAKNRRITNVADGSDAQDAVTVAQLQKMGEHTVQYDTNADGTVNKNKITLAGGTDGTIISNVKDGTADTDAVNFKQLKDKIADVTYAAGNGIDLSNKTISAKGGTGITVDTNGINVNIGKHLTANKSGAIDVQDNGTVTKDNTDLVTGGTVYNALHDGSLTNITVGKDGKDGKDGTDGKEGSIGLNGKDGKDGITTTIIKTEKGQPGKEGKPGAPGVDGTDITRIVYENADNKDGKHTVATLDDGMKYAGDTGEAANVKLDHQLTLSGTTFGVDKAHTSYDEKDWTSDNIAVVSSKVGDDGNAVMNLKLAKDLKDLNSSTYTTTETTDEGDQKKTTTYTTTINGKGVTIQSLTDGTTTNGPSVTKDGIDAGDKAITNIASGIETDGAGHYTDKSKKSAANINDVQTIVDAAKNSLTNGADGLTSKANIDASNIGDKLNYKADGSAVTDADKTANKNAWGAAIGTGVIADPVKTATNDPLANGSQQLVTGGTVYTALTNKANTDMDNVSTKGETVIRNLAKDAVKVVDGTLTTVTSKQDGNATAYMVNIKKGQVVANDDGLVTGSAVYDAIQNAQLSGGSGQTVDLSGKVNVSADNVGRNFSKFSADATTDEAQKKEVTANENAWGNALGTGSIANSDVSVADADTNGSKQLVTGNTVYKEVRPTSDGTYVKTSQTTAQNLTALDTQLGKMSGSAVQYDTVTGGTTVDKTKLTLAGEGGTTISNVKAGEDDADAVNVKQLKEKIAGVTYKEGHGITFGNDKTISAVGGTGITVNTNGINVNLGKHLSATGTNGAIDVNDSGTVTENNAGLVTGGTVYTALHDALNGGTDDVVFGHDGKDGKDGSIGLVGPKGKDGADGKTTTIIKTETGAAGVNGKDGKDGITRIYYYDKDDTTDKHTVATLDDGMKYAGDVSDTGAADAVANVKLDHQLKLSGTTFNDTKKYNADDWTSDNIAVVSSAVDSYGNAVMNLKLAKDLKNLSSSEYKTADGDTTYTTSINGKGLTIQSTDKGATTPTNGPSITIDGINGGGKAITNIANSVTKNADGTYTVAAKTNAATVGDVQTIVDKATDAVTKELYEKADKTYVDTELGKKADKSYVDTELGKKADRTYVDDQLKTKADADKVYTKDQVYTKEEVNSKVTNIGNSKADKDLSNISGAGKQVIKNTMKDDMDKKANVADMAQKANVDASNINVSKWAEKLGTGKVSAGDMSLVTGDTVHAAISGLKGSSLVQSDGTTLTIGSKDTATKVDISGQDAKGNKTGRVITGIVSDASDPNSAANVGYVNGITEANNEQIYRDMNMQYNHVENDISRAAAGSNALAALHPMQEFDPDDKAQFAVGYGHYRNANAGAVGAFYQPDENSMVNFGVSFGNGDAGINAGVTFKFGPGGSGHHALTKTQMAKVINTQAKEIEALKQDNADKDKRIDALEQKMAEILARLDKSQAGA
jgi:hypothetical protein